MLKRGKKIIILIIVSACLLFFVSCQRIPKLLKGVIQLGTNNGIRIETSDKKIIYIDPVFIWNKTINYSNDADIIFITHTHNDHFELQSINKLINNNTILIITPDGVKKAKKYIKTNIITVEPNMEYEVDGINFNTVPAYTINNNNNSRNMNWVGYIININNKVYYISGDTDRIPELNKIKADVVFLPISGGGWQLNVDEAIKVTNIIKPQIAIPTHTRGNYKLAYEFIKKLDKKIRGVVYENGKIKKIVH